jgi:glycosyltransferase involved in cell wall biosynthesis
MGKMDISVVIITYNEEKQLEATLKSVSDIASEIVVVDRFSDDDTVKLAKKYTDRVFQREWTNFSNQKNFGNSKTSFPWIFSLDADERISPELREEILLLKEGEPECSGFSMPRKAYYLGRWIRHGGWYPDRKLRLFRKDSARWEGEYVHESLVIDGKVNVLHGALHHFTYRGIRDHLERINVYSDLEAQKLYARKKKCRWYHLAILPFLNFLKSYIWRAGILDGFAGFVIATLRGYSVFVRYAKLKEIWKKGERIGPFPY